MKIASDLRLNTSLCRGFLDLWKRTSSALQTEALCVFAFWMKCQVLKYRPFVINIVIYFTFWRSVTFMWIIPPPMQTVAVAHFCCIHKSVASSLWCPTLSCRSLGGREMAHPWGHAQSAICWSVHCAGIPFESPKAVSLSRWGRSVWNEKEDGWCLILSRFSTKFKLKHACGRQIE